MTMKRLHTMSLEEFDLWLEERLKNGQGKYGDSHLKRYNLVDITEELLDALNINMLFLERMDQSHEAYPPETISYLMRLNAAFRYTMNQGLLLLQQMDQLIADADCTDEEGGVRVGADILKH